MLRQIAATIFILLLGTVLLYMTSEMPRFGDPGNPSNNELSARYIDEVIEDVNVPNIVTAIITDYRAYDTLGEATVLFAGIVAVLTILAAHSDVGRGTKKDG